MRIKNEKCMHLLVPSLVTELGLKLRRANFKDDLFMVFENYFMFLKVRRTRKKCLISCFFFYFEKHKEYKKQ